MKLETYQVTLTDTFAGEPNFSSVTRGEFKAPPFASQALLTRRAKASVGISGLKGTTEDNGAEIVFKPQGKCLIMFATCVDW